MAVLKILEIPDPRLRAVAKPVAQVDDAVRTLIDDMVETMYDARGIGLAATQLGIEQRVLVIDLQERESEDEESVPVRDPHAFVNPELLWVSDDVSVYNEGCLSIRSEEQTSELQSLMRIPYAVFCLKKTNKQTQ